MSRENFYDEVKSNYRYMIFPILLGGKSTKPVCIQYTNGELKAYTNIVDYEMVKQYNSLTWDNRFGISNHEAAIGIRTKEQEGTPLFDWLDSISDDDLKIYYSEFNSLINKE